ncbi:hypothetical protein HANVADRAFT_3698, partial [Hanseniaspora valbyensis NRRL Y-1626]
NLPPKWASLAPDFEEVDEQVEYIEKEDEFDEFDEDLVKKDQIKFENDTTLLDLVTPDKTDVRGNVNFSDTTFKIPVSYKDIIQLRNTTSNRVDPSHSPVITNEPFNIEFDSIMNTDEINPFERNEQLTENIIRDFFNKLKSEHITKNIETNENFSWEQTNKQHIDEEGEGKRENKKTGSQNLLFWKALSKLYSNMYKISDFPPPTTLLLTENFIAVGTTKGHILLFNHNEFLMLTLFSDAKNDKLQKPISKIKMSNDGTHILASNIDGTVIIWDLNNSDTAVNENSLDNIESMFHIEAKGKGKEEYVENFGFLGIKNNTLIVSYNSKTTNKNLYTMFYQINVVHKQKWLSKETSLNLTSKEVLFKNPSKDNIQIESLSDTTQFNELVTAVLTDSSIQVVTFNKEFPLLFYKDLETNPVMENELLNWFKVDSSTWILCFNKGNTLNGLTFNINEKIPGSSNWILVDEFKFKTSSKITDFSLIDQSLSFILLENDELLLMNLDNGSIIQTSDLSGKNILMPIHKSIFFSGSRLVSLITRHGILLGTFASWQNVILQELRSKNPVTALNFLEEISENENKALRKLLNVSFDDSNIEEDDEEGKEEKREKKSKNNDKYAELKSTFASLVQAILIHLIKKYNKLEVYDINENERNEITDFFKKTAKMDYFFNSNNLSVSLAILENILAAKNEFLKESFYLGIVSLFNDIEGSGVYFPPILVNGVLENINILGNYEKMVKNIIKFDLSCFNIDLMMKYFIEKHDYSACIYIWTSVLNDFETPLCDLVECLSGNRKKSEVFGTISKSDYPLLKDALFEFLENIFASTINQKIYEEREDISISVINFLSSASCIKFSPTSERVLYTQVNNASEPTYPYFRFLLELDASFFLYLLEFYFLNNKQIKSKENVMILEVLLDVMEQFLNLETEQTTLIKVIGIFLSFYLNSEISTLRIAQNLKLIFNAVTISDLYKNESEAALFTLTKYIDLKQLSNDIFGILKRLKFKNVLLYVYFLNGDYLPCLKLALNLKSEKLNGCDDGNMSSYINECEYGNNNDNYSMKLYEIETLVKQNFELLCSIDIDKSVELMFLYDFDFEDVICNINKTTINGPLKMKIIELIINDSRYQLPFTLYIDHVRRKLDDLLEKEPVSKHNIESVASLLREHGYYKQLVKFLMDSNKIEQALTECLKASSSNISSGEDIEEKDIIYFVNIAFEICKKSYTLQNWSTFFLYFFTMHQETSFDDLKKLSLNALMSATVELSMIYEKSNECSLLNVVTNVLENGTVILGKVSSCSDLLKDLSFTYKIETAFLEMILKIFNKDAKFLANRYTEAKLKGWLVNSQHCSFCKLHIYEMNVEYTLSFRCGHHFHKIIIIKRLFYIYIMKLSSVFMLYGIFFTITKSDIKQENKNLEKQDVEPEYGSYSFTQDSLICSEENTQILSECASEILAKLDTCKPDDLACECCALQSLK